MFTIPKGSPLTKEMIKSAIDFNELSREGYDLMERYYLGQHDILERVRSLTLKNNKVVVNHAKYITDINVGYLLGNPIEYQANEQYNIEPILDEYKQQTISDLDHEIAKDVSVFGRQYELVYNVDNMVRSANIDVRNCILVYDDTVQHEKMFGIIYKRGEKKDTFDAITVYDNNFKYDCAVGGKISVGEGEPHAFGKVPIVEYRNNSDLQGDFKQVLPLIDAYNLLQSDRINDKEQLVDAILVLYGFTMSGEQADQLMNERILGNLPLDAKAEYLIKTLNEADTDTLRQVLEQDIHKISMTPNMSDENFVGNSSGVAIRYKLLAFEQSIKNKERYFEKGLMQRFELYNNYLKSINKMQIVPTYEVDAIFKRNLPQNDYETSQMILNLDRIIDRETLIGQLSFIKNAKEVIEANELEEQENLNIGAGEYGTNSPLTNLLKPINENDQG